MGIGKAIVTKWITDYDVVLAADAVPSAHFAQEVTFDNYSMDPDDQTTDGRDFSLDQSSCRMYNQQDSMTESQIFATTIPAETAEEEGYGLPETAEEQQVRLCTSRLGIG